MKRATLDTNVLIAGLQGRGASYKILQSLQAGSFEAAISVALFLEYEDVLTRPEILARTGFTEEDIRAFLQDFVTLAYQAQPIYFRHRPSVLDPGDEHVLECVLGSQSEVLVTLNVRDFRTAADRFGFGLLRPPAFLDLLRSN